MSFSSSLRYPRFDSFVQIHEWQLYACNGDRCAAALLSVFEHKHNAILENRDFDKEVRAALASSHRTAPPDFRFWFSFEDDELFKRIKVAKSKDTLYKSLEFLERKGFIQRDAPVELVKLMRSGRRKWFRFRADRIQPVIDAYDEKLWGAKVVAEPLAPDSVESLTEKYGGELTKAANRIFDDWKIVHESPRSIVDAKRLKLAVNLLKLGYAENRFYLAIRGILLLSHNTGGTNGRFYNGFDLIFRDAANLEKYEQAAIDNGLTPENFRDYVITKSDLRLRAVADIKKKAEQAAPEKVENEASEKIYQATAKIIAEGLSALFSTDDILNTVAKTLDAESRFQKERLKKTIEEITKTLCPIDSAIRKKIDVIASEIIKFQI